MTVKSWGYTHNTITERFGPSNGTHIQFGAPQERQLAVLARTGLSSNVEDLKHFLLERPAYDDLRAVCPAFPADVYTTLSNPGCVAAVMGHSAQAALANTLFHMKVRRSELLELPWV
jgi:hypothetical protein